MRIVRHVAEGVLPAQGDPRCDERTELDVELAHDRSDVDGLCRDHVAAGLEPPHVERRVDEVQELDAGVLHPRYRLPLLGRERPGRQRRPALRRDTGRGDERKLAACRVAGQGGAPIASEGAASERRHALDHVGLPEIAAQHLADLDERRRRLCGFLG
ncbi:MAG: hypothetical protein OZ922_04705 [Myxococcales bacterium]|nr:hypothetical protein [Myxococcales bacterium]